MSAEFVKHLYQLKLKNTQQFPDKATTEQFIDQLFALLFVPRAGRQLGFTEFENEYESLKSHLSTLVYDVVHNGDQTQAITDKFFEELPAVHALLLKDAAAISAWDPAAESLEEVIIAYPGFFAIAVYRFAHQLWKQQVKILPRLFTEYAHSKTGIDIHPGATIGESFFIDHGTGIVIGETTEIGSNVRIYQGVTLGALSGGREKSSGKRHPSIEDNVIIYSGATILGGETVIGKNSTIGGNVWITYPVPAGSLVYHKSEVVAKKDFSFTDAVNGILGKRDIASA
ncbi:serine acetyltransferase [Pseudoflavitalea sp. G-6-1-2]|uniref:serine O-acetyltransferase EpsC n=1 Tax=Pseudoflavitalea sp. G-6-1-2 TaxID=2728841 RepID=UPI001469FE12|nr:serine O-acetyltransferase EpsC [Pseudoflavitalea sp. G-6-1-2]NML19402.1 serine acetyltransferase [Pseudoflavitalea sp. G-6-1-2]